jgi:hypothetical protein
LNELRAYLQRQYPLVPVATNLAEEFDIFDLRHPFITDSEFVESTSQPPGRRDP